MTDLSMPSEITFVTDADFPIVALQNIMINGKMVGWITKRPEYCDRGHWQFNCELPGLDGHDRFPRYYMDLDRAKAEIISFLNWRLWKRRVA